MLVGRVRLAVNQWLKVVSTLLRNVESILRNKRSRHHFFDIRDVG